MNIDIVDFSVYGNETDRSSNALISESAVKKGYQATITEITRSNSRPQVSSFAWLRYDLRSPEDLALIYDLAFSLEKQGCRVFPASHSIILSEDKLETFKALHAAQVPTVDTFSLDKGVRKNPIVIKPRVSWGGRGIRLIGGPEDLNSIPVTERGLYIGQPYIEHEKTFTVALAGGKLIATLRTDSSGDDFRSNCTEGAPPKIVECQPAMGSLAAGAINAMGLVTGTVDIIEDGCTMLVLEVNSAPRLSYETLPGLDLASPMFDSVIEWWRGVP